MSKSIKEQLLITVYEDGTTLVERKDLLGTSNVVVKNTSARTRTRDNKVKLTETYYRSAVIVTGADSDVDLSFTNGCELRAIMNGKEYRVKMHSTHRGRINGCTKLFRDNNINAGDTLEYRVDKENYTVYFRKL